MKQHLLLPEVYLLKVEEVAPRVPLGPGNSAPATFLLSLPSWLLCAKEGQHWALLPYRAFGDGIPSLVDP